jgi:mannose-6-phosphate isomerase-like protein (cupin superfamily)
MHLPVYWSRRRLRRRRLGVRPGGSAVERPARRTPGHVTGWHLISPALSYAAVHRAACAPGPDCPASPATLRGGGGARGAQGFAGPRTGKRVMARNGERVTVIGTHPPGRSHEHERGPQREWEGSAGARTVAHRSAAARSECPRARGRPAARRHRPGRDTDQATHPGQEIIYILEGSLEYQIEGQPISTCHAGDALTVPAGAIHAVRNTGSGSAAELATYVVEKGKPVLTLAE